MPPVEGEDAEKVKDALLSGYEDTDKKSPPIPSPIEGRCKRGFAPL